MTTLSILTPSYAPDYELCRDLRDSIRRYAQGAVTHQIIVPDADLDLFGSLSGPGCTVTPVTDILPRSMRRVPHFNVWVNLHRPFPPVRGWIAQQLVKMTAAAESAENVILLVDSDVVFIRPFSAQSFLVNGTARFYRKPDAVSSNLPRHVVWHQVSRRLLGIQEPVTLPLPDYICWPMPWDPAILRALLKRVETVAGKPWLNVIGSQLHFSEGILYGVFVDKVLGNLPWTDDMLCKQHTGDALDLSALRGFLADVGEQDLCVMVSAKSETPLATRRTALAKHLTAPGSGQPD